MFSMQKVVCASSLVILGMLVQVYWGMRSSSLVRGDSKGCSGDMDALADDRSANTSSVQDDVVASAEGTQSGSDGGDDCDDETNKDTCDCKCWDEEATKPAMNGEYPQSLDTIACTGESNCFIYFCKHDDFLEYGLTNEMCNPHRESSS
eukprot:gnl/MRDRNA2_/MRDRNA2_166835_c0_seq1.p1 gnl/MRDRNA2_/MRDRNA2_166835_c0~~gnl/MRDRNA2_/MRDRNA2_166835_c0_seq1.p1  ORF type:complete len:149 (-),score=26.87 gnl/MRDRNA2_/MRDRNA2_166835_c0_seq1:48-494(-)